MPNRLLDLPPLDLIRSFVAVGRRMSITLAANELCVTQSAVSRQIGALEDSLGYPLFLRGHRSLEFTDEGKRLFRSADAWIEQIGDVIATLKPGKANRAVTISASIGVTSLWLLPRLGALQAAHPGIDIRVATSNRLVHLERENIDLAIRYCTEADAPAGAIRMFGESLVPVAHPAFGMAPIEDPQQLSRSVLLEYDDASRPPLRWAQWFKSAGVASVRPKGTLRFNQYDQAVHAAIAGHGVALGRLPLVRALIDEGQLAVVTRCPPVLVDYSYWLLMRDGASGHDVGVLREWLLAEAARVAR